MSLRAVLVVVAFTIACGGESMKVKKGEPQTAREKMLAEQKAHPEEHDSGKKGKSWGGGWRYQGDRDDCFYIVGRKCYKTEKAACRAARCKRPATCTIEGAGPAAVKCKKDE
jgi:hypothetical protein